MPRPYIRRGGLTQFQQRRDIFEGVYFVLLSRVADSIYWMARYIERAENVARFVDVNLHLVLDLPAGLAEQWEPLVITTGDYGQFAQRYGDPSRENVIQFLTFDTDNPNSILSCLEKARENARSIREVISSEMWSELNEYYLYVRSASARESALDLPHEFFTQIKRASHLLEGVTNATMSHGEAWHFHHMGRLLERADKTTRILDVKYFLVLPSVRDVGSAAEDQHWSAVLRSASAFEMYRKRYRHVNLRDVVRFLVLDPEFPRSVHYGVRAAEDSLHAITGSPSGSFKNAAERRLGQLVSELDYTDMNEVLVQGLHEFLNGLQTKLNQVGDSIFECFFALPPVQYQVSGGA